jgi:hypothetical protein
MRGTRHLQSYNRLPRYRCLVIVFIFGKLAIHEAACHSSLVDDPAIVSRNGATSGLPVTTPETL